MASTNELRPPNVSLPVFSKGPDSDDEDKSKPKFGVAEMVSLKVWFYGSEVRVGLDRQYSY